MSSRDRSILLPPGADEETSLLDDTGVRTSYTNLDSNSHHSEAATFDFRSPAHSHVTPEEVLQRMKYAFTNDGFDAENDFNAAQSLLTTLERSVFRDRVLDNLKETPLSMKQRLRIRRLIYTKPHTRRRREQDMEEATTKANTRQFTLVPFHLWDGTISRLSAYFGSNVASYFKFLRTLLLLNIAAGILMVCFTSVPQAIEGPEDFNSTSQQFGLLSESMLLFGSYSDKKINGVYDQPLAYILTWGGVSLFYLIFIAVAMHVRYRQSKLTDNDDDYDFAIRALCSWDHTIYSKDGAKDHRKALCTELKERIREERKSKTLRLNKRLLSYVGRFISNVIVLALLGGSGYLIYYIAQEFELPDDTSPELKDFFGRYQLSGVVSLVKLIVPVIFEVIVRLEGWSPRTALKFTMLRTTVFYFASLVVFDISLYNVASECSNSSCQNKMSIKTGMCAITCFLYRIIFAKGINTTEICCWENHVGEQVLKVVFVDLGLCIAVGIFVDFAKALLIKCNVCCIKCKCPQRTFKKIAQLRIRTLFLVLCLAIFTIIGGWIKHGTSKKANIVQIDFKKVLAKLELSEFAITSHVLDLIYGQGLIWLGLYFSPLIIVIGIIKLVIVFYFRLFIAKLAMVAPKKVFRASRSGNFYLFILLMTWFLCILPTAYTVVEISPSTDCGPFRRMCKSYDVISDHIGSWPSYLEIPITYMGSAAVIVPVIILLLLIALYYRTKSSSYADLIKELRNQLDFERKVEKRKIYARALSTPFGTASKATAAKFIPNIDSRKTAQT